VKRHMTKSIRAVESRERILEAALRVFAEYGYDGTTIRMICESAGMSVGVINYHWGGKEGLWQSVCELCTQRILDILMESADYTLPPHEAIRSLFESLFDALLAHRELLRIFMWAILEAETIDYHSTRRQFRPLVDFGAAYLKEKQGQGRIPETDVKLALMAVRALFIFAFVDSSGHRQTFGKDLSDPAHAERVKATLIRASMAILGLETPGHAARQAIDGMP